MIDLEFSFFKLLILLRFIIQGIVLHSLNDESKVFFLHNNILYVNTHKNNKFRTIKL